VTRGHCFSQQHTGQQWEQIFFLQTVVLLSFHVIAPDFPQVDATTLRSELWNKKNHIKTWRLVSIHFPAA
jgi:hypothetical protein